MAIQLIKLPGERIWIEYDDVAKTILAIHDKPQITADIQAINETLNNPQYPAPTQVDSDVADLYTRLPAGWSEARRARVTALITAMYQAYQGSDPLYVEAAQLIARRDALVELRARLV